MMAKRREETVRIMLAQWLVLISLLFTARAWAVVPESGIYYDSRRPGLGYYIEVQGTVLTLTVYGHLTSGEPVFYQASGEVTDAPHGYAQLFDPPAQLEFDYPYQFTAPLYQFDDGPCASCEPADWVPSENVTQVGRVYISLVDYGRLFIGFEMQDGPTIGGTVRRLGFGVPGHELRSEGIVSPNAFSIPSFLGTWVFTDKNDPGSESWVFHFDQVEGPLVSDVDLNVPYNENQIVVRYFDSARNAELVCFYFGCGLRESGVIMFYIRFWDIAMDRVLGYVGDELYADDFLPAYRSEHLVTGVRIDDPIPDAAPPPEEEETP